MSCHQAAFREVQPRQWWIAASVATAASLSWTGLVEQILHGEKFGSRRCGLRWG